MKSPQNFNWCTAGESLFTFFLERGGTVSAAVYWSPPLEALETDPTAAPAAWWWLDPRDAANHYFLLESQLAADSPAPDRFAELVRALLIADEVVEDVFSGRRPPATIWQMNGEAAPVGEQAEN